MAQLDPSIILKAGEYQPLDYGQVMEARNQVQLRNLALQRQQRQDTTQAAAQQRMRDIGKQAAGGDIAGAQKAALEAGDFDLYGHVKGLQDDQRAQVRAKMATAAPIAFQAAQLPYEQRKAAIAGASQALINAGWTPEEIANFDPTDTNINQLVASTQTIKDVLDRHDKENGAYTLSPGARRFRGTTEIAAVPEEPKYQSVPAGGMLVQTNGGAPSNVTPGGGAAVGDQIESAVTGFLPGVQVTSRTRSAAHNAEVGGVPNSFHLTGQARDFVPPKGMTTTQLASVVRTKLPGFDVINEGDHVHVEPASRSGPNIIKGPPKASDAPSGYRFKANGDLQPIPGGPGDPKMKAATLKPVPTAAVQSYIGNNTSLRKIDRALAAVKANPKALGAKNYLPDAVMQRADPQGVNARATVSDIGSLLIHDRSGAAVTISETPRLLPFVPQKTDDAATVKKKLANLRAALSDTQGDFESIYSPEQGYKALPHFKGASVKPKPTGLPTDIASILKKYQ